MRDFGGKRSATWSGHEQAPVAGLEPCKRTLSEMLPPARSGAPVQRKADPAAPAAPSRAWPTVYCLFGGVQRKAAGVEPKPEQIHASAQRGIVTASSPLPHADRLQRLFGRHDLSSIKAHTSADAAASAREMGAQAYATGDHVVLGVGADLHTVAHEAAHAIQQRGGVQLKSGVGEVGDAYERHADQVADLVVRGESAEVLLDQHAGGAATGPATDDDGHRPAGSVKAVSIGAMSRSSGPVQRYLEGEPGVDDFFWDNRDTTLSPPLTFRAEDGDTYTEMSSNKRVTHLGTTDQYRTAEGAYLDPESHEWLEYVPSSQRYVNSQNVFYRYHQWRYIHVREAVQDVYAIDQLNHSTTGVWTIGSVFVDNAFYQRTMPSRSGEQVTDNPYAKKYIADRGNPQEIHTSRADAESSTLLELDGIIKQLMDTWIQQPPTQQPLVRVVITGTDGPCDECKLRIGAFVERVQELFTQAGSQTALQPFDLEVESRYLHPAGPALGNRESNYGYFDEQSISIGELVAYQKVRVVHVR